MTTLPNGSKIRFSTPNPWDDPLFRSAIQGTERAQRREDMQRAIDGAAKKDGKQAHDAPGRPLLTLEAEKRAAPITAEAPWVCPGCGYVAKSATTVGAHKRACAGLYERRKNGGGAPAAPSPTPVPPALRCPARSHDEGFACGAIPEPGKLFCPKHEPKNQPPKPMPDKEKRPADVQLDTKAEPKATQTDTSPRAPEATEERAVTATKEPPAKAAEKKPESNCARCGNPPTPVGRKQTRTLVHVDGQEVCGKCMNKIVAARQREAGIKPGPAAKAESKPPETFACDRCGRKDFPGERERNGHLAWCGKKRGADLRASDLGGVGKPGSVADRASKGDTAALAELNRPEPWTEPRAPKPVTVRHRGAGLEIECATVEDAAAFVRLVGATTGAGVEARG